MVIFAAGSCGEINYFLDCVLVVYDFVEALFSGVDFFQIFRDF